MTYDDDLAAPVTCPACGRSIVHGLAGGTACGAPDVASCRMGPALEPRAWDQRQIDEAYTRRLDRMGR